MCSLYGYIKRFQCFSKTCEYTKETKTAQCWPLIKYQWPLMKSVIFSTEAIKQQVYFAVQTSGRVRHIRLHTLYNMSSLLLCQYYCFYQLTKGSYLGHCQTSMMEIHSGVFSIQIIRAMSAKKVHRRCLKGSQLSV